MCQGKKPGVRFVALQPRKEEGGLAFPHFKEYY